MQCDPGMPGSLASGEGSGGKLRVLGQGDREAVVPVPELMSIRGGGGGEEVVWLHGYGRGKLLNYF